MRSQNIEPRKQDGVIAIITAVIMGIVLLLIAQSISISGFFVSKGSLDVEFRQQAYILAFSCFDTALYKLNDDLDYPGNETLQVGNHTCEIEPIIPSGLNTIIKSNATIDRSFSRLEVTLDDFFQIISFKEI
jgi:hypothetical protein